MSGPLSRAEPRSLLSLTKSDCCEPKSEIIPDDEYALRLVILHAAPNLVLPKFADGQVYTALPPAQYLILAPST